MSDNLYKSIFLCFVFYTGLTATAFAEVSLSKGCRFFFSNQGIEACQQAIDTHGDLGSYQRLGSLLEKAHREPEAIEVYKKGLQHYPSDSLMAKRQKLLLSNVSEKAVTKNDTSKISEQANSLKYSCLHLPRNLKLTLKKCESALNYQVNDAEILAVISQIKSKLKIPPTTGTQTAKAQIKPPTPVKPQLQAAPKPAPAPPKIEVKPAPVPPKVEVKASSVATSTNIATERTYNISQESDNRKRFALVIGNSKYKHVTPLKNPVNDASDFAKKLKTLGFEVKLKKNTNRKEMLSAIREFGDTLYKNSNSIGLFYYAGHGVQVDGQNYFIPVSSNVQAVPDLEYENVGMNRLVDYVAYAGNDLNFFIIDACRDNPYRNMPTLTRSLGNSRGLASNTNVPTGTMFYYAAKPGQKAADGANNSRNSPFTSSLIKHMGNSELGIEQIFKRVAIDVYEQTNKQQHPWSEGIITGDFYPGKYFQTRQ